MSLRHAGPVTQFHGAISPDTNQTKMENLFKLKAHFVLASLPLIELNVSDTADFKLQDYELVSSVQNIHSLVTSKNLKIRIYKAIIMPVVLYGCETWSLTLREEGCLRTGC
jgi:hypothetical protein